MTHRQLKTGYFALVGLNTVATSYYFNYLFFFLRDQFGFGNKENLCVSALHGLVYIFAAVQCLWRATPPCCCSHGPRWNRW